MGDVTTLTTWKELADRMGVDPSTITVWKRNPLWRWSLPLALEDVTAIVKWRSEHFESDGSRNLRNDKLRKEIRLLEIEIAKREGKLYEAAEAEAAFAREGNLVRQALQNIPAQLLPDLITMGLPANAAPKAKARIEASINEALRRLSQPLPL